MEQPNSMIQTFETSSDGEKSTEQATLDVERGHGVGAETEKKLLKKLDLHIIPFIMWMYLMNFMDRVIIGNARLYDMDTDLDLTGDQFQLAVSILFVTYCLFETPSNVVLKKFQPARWLAFLTIAWGLVATFSAFVQNFAQLVACRLLLGLFEAGLFPGLVLYLTLFYNRKDIALRNAYLLGTAAIAGAVGGLVAYAVHPLDGTAGWRAWRWLILINGIPTILTGIAVPFVLPNNVETAKFLTETDRQQLVAIRSAEIGQTKSAQEFNKQDALAAVKDWKTWAFAFGSWSSNCTLYAFSVFLPTIISQLGTWNIVQTQALTVPVYAVGFITYLVNARISDQTQQRGLFIIGGTLAVIFGYILLIINLNAAASLAGTFFVAAGAYTIVGMPMSWLTVNYPRYGKRATGSGIQLTIANASGVAAPFLFSNKYAPMYVPGYAGAIGMLGVGLAIWTTLHVYFRTQNRKKRNGEQDHLMQGLTDEQIADLGDKSPRYMYTI